jgi:pectate lyase
MKQLFSAFLILSLLSITIHARVINFETDSGAIPDDKTTTTTWKNGGFLNTTLASLQPGDTLLIPNKTFYLMGGIKAKNLKSVTIQIDGTIIFSDEITLWPRDSNGSVFECLYFENIENVTFTSSGIGLIDGSGAKWWGPPGIGYLERAENRPRLVNIAGSRKLLFENLIFKNSPYWTFWVHEVDGLEVRFCEISARRTDKDRHTLVDMSAFNTDGFDVTGKNVWIHDCTVWNQDDSFCVKDGSENMLFERINASGVGLTIGSISGTTVRNITFRDVYMKNTYKGIYLKFRAGDQPGLIADVLYENIYMENPEQWPIWIGPAQQSDSGNLCAAHPCSICWPTVPYSKCEMPAAGKYQNITLRNITISNPYRTGVIMANPANPMEGVTFDGVKVINYTKKESEYDYYSCENVVNGVATGDTWPVPSCFQDKTNRKKESDESQGKETLILH